jgi:xylose isomerase
MALAESINYDKIEIVGTYKAVQVRKATVITKDDVELTRAYERYVLQAGTLDASDNLVDTDISKEPAEVQAICNAVWTDDVKTAYKAKLIAEKSPSE